MKGILVEKTGGPEVLQLKDLNVPEPGPGQALVKVKSIGLNFIDIYQRRGDYPVALPFTPGMEASGIIEAVGAGVTSYKAGDRVAYTSMPGAYAEASLVKADMLIRLPEDISFELGAALPLQGMTAHYLVNEFRTIKPGDLVLIHAAAGGMGLLLVQWAKHLGARVIGTVSTREKAQAAKEAGADDVINYSEQDFVAEVQRISDNRGVDLIIDGVGKTTFPGNMQVAARRSTIVIFGMASGQAEPISPNTLMVKSITLAGGSLFNYLLDREELLKRSTDVLTGISEGWLKFKIQEDLPLAEASRAHELLENRKSVGKILLHTDN